MTTARFTAALLTLTLTLTLALAPRAAHADDAAAKNEARALLQGGNKLLEKGDLPGALALFESAYAKFPSPLILINIGTTLRDLDRPADAANAYARFIAAPGEYGDRVPKIKRVLAELDRTLGQVEVTVDPTDAELAVGTDRFLPAAALPRWRVTPGAVTVRARKAGYDPAETTASVARGKVATATLRLRVTPAPPTATPPPADTPPGDDADGTAPGELHMRLPVPRPPRFGVTARALVDGRGRGAAGSVGALVRVHARVELLGAVIFARPGELTLGAYAGAHLELGHGTWRPRLAAGVPVIFDDGARVSGRAALGVAWHAAARVAVVLELGGEYGFNPADDIDAWQLTPILGAEAHL